MLFYKPVTTLIGPTSDVIIPKAAQPVQRHVPDYEVELAVVIGKPAKNVSEADALDFILGYTGANDVSGQSSARLKLVQRAFLYSDIIPTTPERGIPMGVLQRIWYLNPDGPISINTYRPLIDNTNPLGPCLVASHSVPDPQQIPLGCTINAQVRQSGNTAYVCLS